MKTVDEAFAAIFNFVASVKINPVSLENASGLYLAEDILADRDFPPFHRVAMDGVAINMSSYLSGQRKFSIEGIRKAGEDVTPLFYVNSALEVMTGCMLPLGTNIIIPYEQVEINEGKASLKEGVVLKPMMNVHLQGSDAKKGAVLLERGTKINAPEMAILASVGKTHPLVFSIPKIAFVGTGDELVEISVAGNVLKPYQIRQSNGYAVKSLIESFGPFNVDLFHLPDNQSELYEGIKKQLEEYEMVILSGGVSAGKFDYIPSVLRDLKVQEHFHKVAQRPGKPLWYGVGELGQMVFGLPGNPVSALINCRRYIVTILGQLISGGKLRNVFAGEDIILADEFHTENPYTLFKPALIKGGQLYFYSTNGSGDFVSLAGSDGFVELPPLKNLNRGDKAKFFGWRA